MKLIEVFNQLTAGEFSQLSIGGGEQGEISEANYDKILAHINLGLTALYQRFNLKEREMVIALSPTRRTYFLHSRFAASNLASSEPVKYILDTDEDAFIDDLMKVERIYGESGEEFSLNNSLNPYTIHTPSLTSLTVPQAILDKSPDLPEQLKTSTLRVVYRANHPLIVQSGNFIPDNYDIELPYTHLEALLYFVAARVITPIGMVTEFQSGNNYASKYELACRMLETKNYQVDQGNQSNRLRDNGWV